MADKQRFAFYSDKDFDADLRVSREFWGHDVVYTATLFRFDGVRSQIDDLYGETLAEEKVFFPPVEVTVVPNIGELTTAYQIGGGLAKQQYSLTLGFYLDEVTQKNCRPHMGDFVAYGDGQGVHFYELTVVDELLGRNTRGGTPYYIGAAGVLKGGDALPPGLRAWVK